MLDGGSGDDELTGGFGADRIDVAAGNDVVFFHDVRDRGDRIDGFDADPAGGQDRIDLGWLFTGLGIAGAARAGGEGFGIVAGSAPGSYRLWVDVDDNDATGSFSGFDVLMATVVSDGSTFDYADVLV